MDVLWKCYFFISELLLFVNAWMIHFSEVTVQCCKQFYNSKCCSLSVNAVSIWNLLSVTGHPRFCQKICYDLRANLPNYAMFGNLVSCCILVPMPHIIHCVVFVFLDSKVRNADQSRRAAVQYGSWSSSTGSAALSDDKDKNYDCWGGCTPKDPIARLSLYYL